LIYFSSYAPLRWVSGLAVEGRILGVRISCVSYAPGYNVPLDNSGRADYAQGACFWKSIVIQSGSGLVCRILEFLFSSDFSLIEAPVIRVCLLKPQSALWVCLFGAPECALGVLIDAPVFWVCVEAFSRRLYRPLWPKLASSVLDMRNAF
jgi:hypothetical protein